MISHKLGLYPSIGKLLVARGVRSLEEAEQFLHPRLDQLHDPFLMEDMQVATERLSRAIDTGEGILIYGDYDVDGTTAVSLLYRYLRSLGVDKERLHYYIPDRHEEGYGITPQGLHYASQSDTQLIITVDTGIKAHAEIAEAQEQGVDVIICDHHTPDETLPPALAILNPKRLDNSYPFTDLSGCGVAFKLIQALAQRRSLPFETLIPSLELLVLSIAQDRVSLLGENRIFTYFGLKQMNSHPSIGLDHLIRLGRIQPGRVEMESIYYELGPRINAAGRMAHGAESVKLLIAEDRATAEAQSLILDNYNRQRQELDQRNTQEAIDLVESSEEYRSAPILVLYQPEWNKGVMGIVAARLADRYHRPVIILSGTGDELAGSGRSSGGFNLYEALQSASDLLVNFGGHIYASGLTIRRELLPQFRERLLEYIASPESHLEKQIPPLQLEMELAPHDLSRNLLRQIEQLSPFGACNERPLFLVRHLRDAGGSRAVGKRSQHLSLRVTDYYQRMRPLHGFALGLARYEQPIIKQQPFAIAFDLEENNFYPQSFLQLRIKDLCLESELEGRLTTLPTGANEA